jgi:hypothetical protein
MRIDPLRIWAAVEAAREADCDPRHEPLSIDVRDHKGRLRDTPPGQPLVAAGVTAANGADIDFGANPLNRLALGDEPRPVSLGSAS